MRSKLLSLTPLLLVSSSSLVLAQTDRSTLQVYLGARYTGQAIATFGNVGTIYSDSVLGDTTTVMTRRYTDGTVALDERYTDDGDKIPPDGRTNTWRFRDSSQVLEDGFGIAFNDYTTDGVGQTVSAETPGSAGLEMEFALRVADYGAGGFGLTGPFNWGVSFGFGLNDLNIKYRESIKATLNVTTDVYSLLGATAPEGPYGSPSRESVIITNPDGTVSSYTVDTSILLQDLPYDRTTSSTPEGADVNGYWELDGTFFTFRLGPWIRWRPFDRVSFRASAGISGTALGVTYSYDERTRVSEDTTLTTIVDGGTERYDYLGYYGSFDAEFWITSVTGIYAGVTYQNTTTDMRLETADRWAELELSTSVGFHIGITTHF
jgi:hypothetical protein